MSGVLGKDLVLHVLQREGVRQVFCVPGESYLGVLDALRDTPEIGVVWNRHEGGAAFMAEAYAKSSGRVGVCMATRAVGAANLAIGLHTAMQDSTPVVALIGDVEAAFSGREAFQEIDVAGFLGHVCKWTTRVERVERIPEVLHRAFYMAKSGRPGPVAVSIPQDVLEREVMDENKLVEVVTSSTVYPREEDVEAVLVLLSEAKRPLIIAGGGVIQSNATALLVRLAEKLQVPVVTAFRRHDAFPNEHPNYIGWLGFGLAPHLRTEILQSDVILALGTRFSQISSADYTLLSPESQLLHVDISPETIGKVYAPEMGIVSDIAAFLKRLLGLCGAPRATPERVAGLHRRYMEFSTPRRAVAASFVDMDGFMYDFVRMVPRDAIITHDAGNFAGWPARYHRHNEARTFVGPTSGAMGYGFPAAVAAKLAQPDKVVISFSGDGGFMMTAQEFETAVRHKVPVIAVVVNNQMYGTIRAHQERAYPGRTMATVLTNPDFSEWAKLCGGDGMQVRSNRDAAPALQRALTSTTPFLLEVFSRPDVLSVNQFKT